MNGLEGYLPIGIHFLLVVALTGLLLALHALVGGRRPNPEKVLPYESGVWPIGTARERVPVRYYVIAMLFLLFDVEIVFLYPWAVLYRVLGIPGLVEMAIFLGVLLIGFWYAWQRRALEWE
ncbi:MAG: NADH-quinone oxidoreductase subunit A [Armatimonadota bacterium]|nr:NADH-quinone oxidoreductase subunit A [Armatimonadota bacterium]MDR5702472.1 NADH-quinone oxidoreductase subunit A [Armatimonadota bacterium]MDR7433571.1 NADH-quinone oxidoreductase subunit A [Armatimonadota bacterium]